MNLASQRDPWSAIDQQLDRLATRFEPRQWDICAAG
jgi:hypothetical protein